MTDRLEDAWIEAAAAPGPDTIALMRVLMDASDEGAARAALARAVLGASGAVVGRLAQLQALWTAHPKAWTTVRSVIGHIGHEHQAGSPDETLRYLAESFDRMAAESPEGSVALYSLGSPELLAAATDEIVAWMEARGLLGPDRDALDLGCGIGRFLRALSPRLRSITGLDISSRMVAEARMRCADLANVSAVQASGRDLGGTTDGSLDLVLAADVFPYLVQANGGLAEAHVAEFARVLRPGGAALILNYSYRGDLAADRRDIVTSATAHKLAVELAGDRPFTLWDGSAYLLRR